MSPTPLPKKAGHIVLHLNVHVCIFEGSISNNKNVQCISQECFALATW